MTSQEFTRVKRMPPSLHGVTDHGVMRTLNRNLVLDYLRRSGPCSRTAVAEATGLAKPTVSVICEDLLLEGLIFEQGHGLSGTVGGRPPVMLSFNARSAYLVGVHVGVQRTTVIVADGLGGELAATTIPTPTGDPPMALAAIAHVVGRTLADAEADSDLVRAAGICLPGLVSKEDGRLLLAPNLGWRDVPVAQLLEQQIGVPVEAFNASQTSLIAEVSEGAAVGASDAVLLYAGTGIGAAALSGGRLILGERGLAGEVGHCQVRPDGPRCNCGRIGCLETVASASAIAAETTRRWRACGRTSGPWGSTVGTRAVAAAAQEGDPDAKQVLAEAGRALGQAAAWLINVLDPAVLVLAGGLSGIGENLTGPFRQAVGDGVLPQVAERLQVEISQLGQEAEVRGVVILARERLERGPVLGNA